MDRIPVESTVLQRRAGYREVFRHYVRLRLAPMIPFSPDALLHLLELKNIAELYELWSFFQIITVITRVLGPPISAAVADRTKRDAFSEVIPRGLDVSWTNGTRVFYNLRFSQHRSDRHSYSVPLRPDITLEIPTGPNRGLHLFDAKFRLDRVPSLHPDDLADDEEGDNGIGTFKSPDLYKMHTYRDAISAARSVWVLYPGVEFKFFSEAHCAAEPHGLPDVLSGVGAIPLRPDGDQADLFVTLMRLLK